MKVIFNNAVTAFLNGDIDILIQGCNTVQVMGGGIAREIVSRIKGVRDVDIHFTERSSNRIGKYSAYWMGDQGVINAYVQLYPGKARSPKEQEERYGYIRACLQLLKKHGVLENKRIGYPMVGAGLAGGDWEIISKIFDEELAGYDHTLYRIGFEHTSEHIEIGKMLDSNSFNGKYAELADGIIKDVIEPVINKHARLYFQMDTQVGHASCFLFRLFNNLYHLYGYDFLKEKILIVTEDETIKLECEGYMRGEHDE